MEYETYKQDCWYWIRFWFSNKWHSTELYLSERVAEEAAFAKMDKLTGQ